MFGNDISWVIQVERRFVFAPKGLRRKAQGCRLGYPGKRKPKASQPQGGCVREFGQSQPRCGGKVGNCFVFPG